MSFLHSSHAVLMSETTPRAHPSAVCPASLADGRTCGVMNAATAPMSFAPFGAASATSTAPTRPSLTLSTAAVLSGLPPFRRGSSGLLIFSGNGSSPKWQHAQVALGQ